MASATRALFAIAAFVIAFLGSEGRAQDADSLPPAVVVVRHADTLADIPGDRPLNAEGARRSRDLLAALRIIQALGGPRVPQICETVFDNLFVLMPVHRKAQLLHARYGAPSPPSGPDCP